MSALDVVNLLEAYGADPYDEEVAQLDHALQTAALARADGAGDALVAAALLHDVGHLLHIRDGGDPAHDTRGAAWLLPRFGATVATPVALHVEAKRYLCAVDPGYSSGLSAGSVRSLARQGGPFTVDEAAAFERRTGADDAVRLRRWDDRGKVDGLDVAPLASYHELLARLATA